MLGQLINWLWNIGSRDLCALIGVSFIAASGLVWITGRTKSGLDNIANAIRRK